MLARWSRFIVLGVFAVALNVGSTYAQQTVFLDFSGTDGSIAYSAADKAAILAIMDGHYAPWDFTFTLTAPTAGPFSTVTFNAGGPGGLAEHIDFGNTDKSDSAVVNITGLGIPAAFNVMATANIGSHELGHLVGLRHGDSFGPIGSGVHAVPGPGGYFPTYPGPAGAVETTMHVMASPGSVGSSIGDVTTPNWFSERSAIKLTVSERPDIFISEVAGPKGTLGTAQAITLKNMIVPNTIVAGANAGGPDFSVDAAVVLGSLTTGTEVDFFSFLGSAGDLMNLELISAISGWKAGASVFDTALSVFDAGGSLIPYYSSTAFNDDEFESFDSILIDLFLPADGMYFVKVDRSSFAPGATGSYELFINRFNGAIPEPGSVALLVMGMIGIALSRRRNG